MLRVIDAELIKIRTTRMWWGLLIGLVVLVALQVGVTAAFAGSSPGPGAPRLPGLAETDGLQTTLAAGFQSGYLMALVLGTVIGAVDFRHRTATQTFLATPQRGRVIVAKAAASVVYGLVYAVLTQLLALAVVALVAAVRGIGIDVTNSSVLRSLLLGVPGIVLWCLIGVSLGVLLRNQIAAVLIAIGFVFVVDPLIGVLWQQLDLGAVAEYTLSNASAGLVETSTGHELLPWWAGGLVLLGYGVLIGLLGSLVTSRRDVT